MFLLTCEDVGVGQSLPWPLISVISLPPAILFNGIDFSHFHHITEINGADFSPWKRGRSATADELFSLTRQVYQTLAMQIGYPRAPRSKTQGQFANTFKGGVHVEIWFDTY